MVAKKRLQNRAPSMLGEHGCDSQQRLDDRSWFRRASDLGPVPTSGPASGGSLSCGAHDGVCELPRGVRRRTSWKADGK